MHDSSKLLTGLKFKQTLRYGENPQQQATWCVYPDHGLSSANQLQGKELSYNNLIDLDAAVSTVKEFPDEPAAVVDGNVYRVLSRYFGIETPINSTNGIKEFKKLASSLIDRGQPALFNQAIMEFGATQCKPKNPNCVACPLNESCVALQKNLIDILPVKLKKTKVKTKFFNFLVCIDNNNKTILEKRTSKGIWQNLYQFPLIESDKSLSSDEFYLLN